MSRRTQWCVSQQKTSQKRKKKKKMATRESEGPFVIRLKTPSPAQPAEAMEEEGRQGRTAKVLTAPTIYSAEDGAVLAAEAVSVQVDILDRPVQSTDEVHPTTKGEEPIMEIVGLPMLGAS
jgi:hypothetical protein